MPQSFSRSMIRTMSGSFKQLPVDERIRLVEDLWDSIAADQSAIALSSDQRAELDRRLEAFEFDGDMGRSAAAVIPELRKRL